MVLGLALGLHIAFSLFSSTSRKPTGRVRYCVPKCKNDYDRTKKVVGNISVFLFPKEPERRDLRFKRINQENFVVTGHSAVCIDHFEENFIIREDSVTRPDGYVLLFPERNSNLQLMNFLQNFPISPSISTNRRDPDDRAASILLVTGERKNQKQAILNAKDIICEYLDLTNKRKTSKYLDSNVVSLLLNDKNVYV